MDDTTLGAAGSAPPAAEGQGTWVDVGTEAEVTRQKRVVVTAGDDRIVVFAHEGRFYALLDTCIHKARQLNRGVILNGRIVCPGHQWSFDLETGWEAVKGECQPVFDVRVDGGVVQVDPSSRRTLPSAPTGS